MTFLVGDTPAWITKLQHSIHFWASWAAVDENVTQSPTESGQAAYQNGNKMRTDIGNCLGGLRGESDLLVAQTN